MTSPYRHIPVREETLVKLRAYKKETTTFDELLNEFMKAVPLEDVSPRVLREHRRRLKTWQGQDWRKMRDELGDR